MDSRVGVANSMVVSEALNLSIILREGKSFSLAMEEFLDFIFEHVLMDIPL
jgi:hypothetical protein